MEPMYATTAAGLPDGDGWVFEPKYDGVRVLAHAAPDGVRLVTRNGRDKAAQFPEIVDALRRLARRRRRPLVLDGEIVALANDAPARFQALQSRTHLAAAGEIERRAAESPAALVAFDLLADGDDGLLDRPWRERRRRLERLLGRSATGPLRLGESLEGAGSRLLARARQAGWEGLIAKRADAPYRPGLRSRDWRKLKVEHQQEFVVGGWTEPRRTRPHLGALLLGYHDAAGRLRYAGHAGGGFTHEGLRLMRARLERLARRTPPFVEAPAPNETVHWVRPQVVVEVRFSEWTSDGRLRQPIVLGVRDDKPARSVVREPESVQAAGGRLARAEADAAGQTRATRERDPMKRATTGRTTAKRAAAEPAAKKAPPGRATAKSATPTKAATRKAATRKAAGGQAATKRTATTRTATTRAAATRTAPAAAYDDVVAQLERIEAGGGDGTLRLPDGAALDVTSLGRVVFPEGGFTKGELLRYYARVAPLLLPIVADRPLVLRRFPRGAAGPSFFQQNAPDPPPDGVRAETIVNDAGERQHRFVGGGLGTLLHTVQIGAISVDPWNARVGSLDRVDYVVLDLDPGEGVPFGTVIAVARLVRAALDELGLDGRLKTSGKRGLHVFVPLADGATEKAAVALAKKVATRVAKRDPAIATVERSVAKRAPGTVYVDYLQNIVAKPVAAAYCARATPAATVSTPLAWDELTDDLDPAAFTIATVPARLARVGDLWGR
jgi:bifunctional non-homologous end joining protein LigD